MTKHFPTIAMIAGLLACAVAAGCGTATQEVPQTQAAGTTVYQFQILPIVSENARPVNSQESTGGIMGEPRSEKVAETISYRDNKVTVTVTTDSQTAETGQQGEATDANATPTTDVSPEIDVTP